MLDLATDEFVPFRRLEHGEEGFAAEERQKRGGTSFMHGVRDDVRAELEETAELARDGLPKFDLDATVASFLAAKMNYADSDSARRLRIDKHI